MTDCELSSGWWNKEKLLKFRDQSPRAYLICLYKYISSQIGKKNRNQLHIIIFSTMGISQNRISIDTKYTKESGQEHRNNIQEVQL